MCVTDWCIYHYDDVIMDSIASQITSLTIVYSTFHSGADQSKHQSSALLAFVWEIHRWPVNFPHKWPVTRKMFPFDDVIMCSVNYAIIGWDNGLYHAQRHPINNPWTNNGLLSVRHYGTQWNGKPESGLTKMSEFVVSKRSAWKCWICSCLVSVAFPWSIMDCE